MSPRNALSAAAIACDDVEALRLDADAALLDIEGTLSPISFVRDVLFPYAYERIPAFVADHRHDTAVADILTETSRLADGQDPVIALQRWQEQDKKVAPLKKLQGLVWEDGYRSGAFQSPVYADALSALQRWRAAGLPLYIYSSGSIAAQLLFFEHSIAGDLRPLFSAHFDLDTGSKTVATSYTHIAGDIGLSPERIVFFSDNPAEINAAASARFQAVHAVKDGTAPVAGLQSITTFDLVEISRRPQGKTLA